MKEVFDATLGRHGGTRYRSEDGRFTPNPNKGKPWYCQKSPTGAHHWIITAHQGRCKYCQAVQEVPTSPQSAYPKRSRGVVAVVACSGPSHLLVLHELADYDL